MIEPSTLGQPLGRAGGLEEPDATLTELTKLRRNDCGGQLRDTYRDIAKLMVHESRHITIRSDWERRSPVAIIAPHAGSIEPFTGELAEAIAGSEHRLYCFTGGVHEDSHRLHVTSARFSEPVLTRVLLGASVAISVHGCRNPQEPVTHLGGTNDRLRNRLERSLLRSGFAVDRAIAPLAGRHPHNVVNRTVHGGVQFEITRLQRRALMHDRRTRATHEPGCHCSFCRYVEAIRAVLELFAASTFLPVTREVATDTAT
jgi:phage replication-related protein YjqB (UPF0714/DUF867 family)